MRTNTRGTRERTKKGKWLREGTKDRARGEDRGQEDEIRVRRRKRRGEERREEWRVQKDDGISVVSLASPRHYIDKSLHLCGVGVCQRG